jgi:hypothetical protein
VDGLACNQQRLSIIALPLAPAPRADARAGDALSCPHGSHTWRVDWVRILTAKERMQRARGGK